MTPPVHVVEPGGRGGVHHHAAALATALAQRGVTVKLYTAAEAEDGPDATGVVRRACSWSFSEIRPSVLRRAAVAASWLSRGIPTCLGSVRRGDAVQVEGWFHPALLVPLVVGARLRGARVILSPHNTFSRRGRPSKETVVRWMARHADAVLAFSSSDQRQIEGWGARPVRAPLLVHPPAPDAALVAGWRRRWDASAGERPVVLLAGHLRPDKGLEVLVQAAAAWRDTRTTAVVGLDLGALGAARRLSQALGVPLVVDEGYQPLARFVAAVAAADVVVCPYRVASQSAVLALAAALGQRTVATDVGGLAELAMVAVAPGDPAALARGVDRALRMAPPPPQPPPDLAPYLRAYGAAVDPAPVRR